MRRCLISFSIVLLSIGSLAGPVSAGVDPLDRPVEARFEGAVTLDRAYELLGDLAGIRFVFDEGVRLDERFTLDAGGLTMRQALEILDLKAGLSRYEVSPGVQIVAPDNQTKRREYEVQAVRTFYLQHAEVKAVNALLRGIIDIRKTAVDESTRSMTIRDTEAKLALAAELIAHVDVERPAVGLTIEVWLLNKKRAEELRKRQGPSGVLAAGSVDEVRRRSGVEVLISQRLGTLDRRRLTFEMDDESRLTFALEATPRLQLDAKQMSLDVAARVGLSSGPGPDSPVAMRRLESSARLGEAETLVLAGLIQVDPETRRARGVLTESQSGARELEVAVLVTPRVGTWPIIPEEHRATLLIGTERRISFPPR